MYNSWSERNALVVEYGSVGWEEWSTAAGRGLWERESGHPVRESQQ